MDNHEIFNTKIVAEKISSDLKLRNKIAGILDEYLRSTNKSIAVKSVQLPKFTVSQLGVRPLIDAEVRSRIFMKRPLIDVITNSYETMTLTDNDMQMKTTKLLVGFSRGLRFAKTHLMSDFDLARVKINNAVTMRINNEQRTKNLSADIIDMPFIKPFDTKSLNIHNNVASIGCEEFTMRRVMRTQFCS
jgi:hypothetical protein